MPYSISFIVTARNEPQPTLDATIAGLLETSRGYRREILVIDDASDIPVSPDSRDVLLMRNDSPQGVCRSRRQGASIASGDVLVWLDAHMSFAPDWLYQMLAWADSGALLCAAWWDYALTRPVCWGADFRWSGERNHKAGSSPGFAFRHRTAYPGEGAVEVPMVIGACYMLLRDSYTYMGGFSPFFRVWGRSEQDISARAWITGLGARCVTGARVGHLSRSAFPYPVRWSDIEFNQVVTVRTVFEQPEAIEELLQPLPAAVERWLAQMDFRRWREWIEPRRQMSDVEFLRRFVPAAPPCLLCR